MRVAVLACAWVSVGTSAWGQPPADCKPNSLNIPGAPYPCIYPDNRVIFRVAAPEAQNVRVRLGQGFDMSLFLGIGSAEGPGTKTFSEQLTQAGIKNTYYESPGTAHEWLTWRRCFKEFAPRLFR